METEHLRLIYIDGLHSFLAPHAARCFENSYAFHRRLWGQDLSEKVTVFLHDLGDQGNGGAKNIPNDLIVAAIAPFNYAFETMPANERMNTIMNHEEVHIYAMDRTAGRDRFFRTLFWGKPEPIEEHPETILYDFLTSPRRSAPRWYQEGIAVFLETWMAGGYGRALGAYDELVFRTKVHDSARFYDQVGVESEATKADFHVGVNSYLYGTRFMSYLALQYGPEKVIEWVSRTDSSRAYFLSQFHHVFSISMDEVWKNWVAWETQFQHENLSLIREYPVTPSRDLTDKAFGSVSRAFYDSSAHNLLSAVSRPGELAFLGSLDLNTGDMRKLTEIKGPSLFVVTSTAFDPASRTLFYTTDNFGWRDLRSIDLSTGHTRTLLENARIGDLVFCPSDSSLWGVRHFNAMSTMVRMPYPYDEWHTVRVWPYGKDLYDIDISRDGRSLVGSLAEVSGRQVLIHMDVDALLAGDSAYTELHDFGNAIPQSFVFSPDARYLYGSSFYTGASNLFRYDIHADTMEALTNCETGFFRPIPMGGDSLIVFRYSAEGFLPAMVHCSPIEDINAIRYLGQQVVNRHPIVTTWMAGSPGSINLDTLSLSENSYVALTNWNLTSMYPVVEAYKSYTAGGMRMNFGDHLGLQRSSVTVSYAPDRRVPNDERWHAKADYSYGSLDLSGAYNPADFYDLFGPTKVSRKGYVIDLQYEKNLIYDEPREMGLTFGLSHYGDLERLPDYQNVATSVPEFQIANVDWRYENKRASQGAVDYEKGLVWQLSTYLTHVRNKSYPQAIASLDFGAPVLLPHSSWWLRLSGGVSHGDRDDPFANFFLGGFGNNWVDHRSIKRYREWYSFPGLELNEIGGRNFAKAMIEWNVPPLRFRRLGFPALYVSWMRLSAIASALATNVDDDPSTVRAGNVGVQLDMRLRLLSQLNLTFSVGVARAALEHQRASDEVMASLKVL